MDDRPAFEDLLQYRSYLQGHWHRCWCGGWWHEDGDSQCVEALELPCPVHVGAARPPEQLAL